MVLRSVSNYGSVGRRVLQRIKACLCVVLGILVAGIDKNLFDSSVALKSAQCNEAIPVFRLVPS